MKYVTPIFFIGLLFAVAFVYDRFLLPPKPDPERPGSPQYEYKTEELRHKSTLRDPSLIPQKPRQKK